MITNKINSKRKLNKHSKKKVVKLNFRWKVNSFLKIKSRIPPKKGGKIWYTKKLKKKIKKIERALDFWKNFVNSLTKYPKNTKVKVKVPKGELAERSKIIPVEVPAKR